MLSRKRVGVVGVSGYGGGEILRLCARHPAVEVVYAAGESSAGQRLGSRYPGLDGPLADLTIQGFDPAQPARPGPALPVAADRRIAHRRARCCRPT